MKAGVFGAWMGCTQLPGLVGRDRFRGAHEAFNSIDLVGSR